MNKKIPTKITLQFVGYHIEGVAVIEGPIGNGVIIMNPFDIDCDNPIESTDQLTKEIKPYINDNGYGAFRILGAWVVKYANYSNKDVFCGTKVYLDSSYIDCKNTPKEYIEMAEQYWLDQN